MYEWLIGVSSYQSTNHSLKEAETINILITGATGLIGQALVQKLNTDKVIVLSRNMLKATSLFSPNVHIVQSLTDVNFNTIDVVINLAGEPIADKRWSVKQKKIICDSRWTITQTLSERINQAETPPSVFISGSAIGFYGRQTNDIITEDFTGTHHEFTHEVCHTWERIALNAQSNKTRVCLLRTGIVLDRKNGALSKMLPAFKLGLGGPISSGKQVMSWIHIDDMVNVILEIIDNPHLFGPINATAPQPLSNKNFSKILSDVLHRPCLLRTPKPLLALLLGELSELLLYGQHVIPEKLMKHDFKFMYPSLEPALRHLLENKIEQ